jgi:hypothetical protein
MSRRTRTALFVHTGAAPSSAFYNAAIADSPDLYLRLGEGVGTTIAQTAVGTVDGVYSRLDMQQAVGLLPNDADTAATFNGLSDYVSLGDHFRRAGTSPFSVACLVDLTALPTTVRAIASTLGSVGVVTSIARLPTGAAAVGSSGASAGGASTALIYSLATGAKAIGASGAGTPSANAGQGGWECGVTPSGVYLQRVDNLGNDDTLLVDLPALSSAALLIFAYDGLNMMIDVQGAQVGTQISTLSIPDAAVSTMVGNSANQARPWLGALDEVLFFPTALSQGSKDAEFAASGLAPVVPVRVLGASVAGTRYDNTFSGTSNLPEPVFYAQNAHVVVLGANNRTVTLLDGMRAANPDMLILLYMSPLRGGINAGFPGYPAAASNGPVSAAYADSHDTSFPSDPWKLYSPPFTGYPTGKVLRAGVGSNYLLDVGRASLQARIVTVLMDILHLYPQVDGFFFDEMNASYKGYLVGDPLKDPVTGAAVNYSPLYPTDGEGSLWQTKTVELMKSVSDVVRNTQSPRGRNYYTYLNAGQVGNWYVDPTYGGSYAYVQKLAPYGDAFLYEWSVQSPAIHPGDDPATLPIELAPDGDPTPYPMIYGPQMSPAHWTGWWEKWYQMPYLVQQLGKDPFFGNTLTAQLASSGSGAVAGSDADDLRKMSFSRASFLQTWNGLGDGGQYFWYRNNTLTSPFHQIWTTDPGLPSETPTLAVRGGVGGHGYRRYWQNVVACVNPHPTLSETFNLTGPYTNLETGVTASSFTIAAKHGLVAVPA